MVYLMNFLGTIILLLAHLNVFPFHRAGIAGALNACTLAQVVWLADMEMPEVCMLGNAKAFGKLSAPM